MKGKSLWNKYRLMKAYRKSGHLLIEEKEVIFGMMVY